MNILLLEDDIVFADMISEYLIENQFIVTTVYDGEEAEELIYTDTFNLLLFDINVPSIDGLTLANKIKSSGFNIPIIFLSSASGIENLKKAYQYGANDFIKKPFILEEILIRIKYIQRSFFIDSTEIIKISNNITFNLLSISIQKENEIIYLPKKEGKILKYFLLNKNRIISINELIINVWGYDSEPSIATIRTYIKNIRKYLEKDSFETIKGLGYILKK
ncbi:response regulator transcription factor [Arcobacter sp. KX21116]|jgi:DNA-binding response OmpR family regulator|uniref:response regulator transcription factor n=1 Tax=Arcobacter iocasae TaxID=2906515 RepID=UPI0035D40985